MSTVHRAVALLVLAFLLWVAAGDERSVQHGASKSAKTSHCVAGDFETHTVLLLPCHGLAPHFPDLFADVVEATLGRVSVVALVTGDWSHAQAAGALLSRGVSADDVRFVEVPHNTMWLRDSGPLVVRSADGAATIVDTQRPQSGRADDDRLPRAIGDVLGLPVVHAPLVFEGGNLLANGEGLCLTTTAAVRWNERYGYGEDDIAELFTEYFGARETVFLEPLAGEPTGHLDMFAVFTSPRTVVVGRYDPQVDPVNARRLDDCALRLAQVRTHAGPLHVVRVPMPPHHDGVWRTYTNVLFANGTLLVPTYPGLDPAGQAQAVQVYHELLPAWDVVCLDAAELAWLGGSLRCISNHVVHAGKLPPQKVSELPPIIEWEPPALHQPGARAPRWLRGSGALPARGGFSRQRPSGRPAP